MARAAPNWFLGFDCATKTFAFSLSRIDHVRLLELKGSRKLAASLRSRHGAIVELLRRAEAALAARDSPAAAPLITGAARALAQLDAETRGLIRIVAGSTADLYPGIPDTEISTVDRIRGVVRFVEDTVRAALRTHVPDGEAFRVVVEFQMGPNAAARTVAAALVTLFATEDVVIVGPTLKNKIATCEQGRYCYFAEKYRTSYTANKNHAKFNFSVVESAFGTGIPPTKPAALRGHIADSFMQVLGHLLVG
jgi:hypothetical protein